ncbi:MAG TPA: hypothetical protein PLT23_06150 [Lentisphaeria bacterium]|nr:MAG: hypothetical protein BWX73_02639 [Lentisphaerae bacterium ADurb.Bin082]HPY90293.1 hypothetical protein [Lentisphaeria bacterium]
MSDMNLTQSEADALIAIEKHRVSDERSYFPMSGESLSLPLQFMIAVIPGLCAESSD